MVDSTSLTSALATLGPQGWQITADPRYSGATLAANLAAASGSAVSLPSDPMAGFGDSRMNGHTGGSTIDIGRSGASASAKANNRVPMFFELNMLDTEYRYNFGVSGDQVVNWASLARSSGKNIQALKDYAPKKMIFQEGINDYVAGSSRTTVTNAQMDALGYFMQIGAKVLVEGTMIASASQYDGTLANSQARLNETLAGNLILRNFCAAHYPRLVYSDFNSAMADATGFLSSQYSPDGLHDNVDAAMFQGAQDARLAIAGWGQRNGILYTQGDGNAPNLIRWTAAGPSMFTSTEVGTVSATVPTWNADPVSGEYYAEVVFTCTALAGGFARARLEIHADSVSGGSPQTPIFVGDRLQGSGRWWTDDNNGGVAQYQSLYARQRLYSDTKFADAGGQLGAAGTSLLANHRGRTFLPTITTATASVGISGVGAGAGYPLQTVAEFNAVGQTIRMRVYSPCLRQVSGFQMPTITNFPATPGTYTNTSNRAQYVFFDVNGGTVSALTFARSGAAAVAQALTSAWFWLEPDDQLTCTYSAGQPRVQVYPSRVLAGVLPN